MDGYLYIIFFALHFQTTIMFTYILNTRKVEQKQTAIYGYVVVTSSLECFHSGEINSHFYVVFVFFMLR